MLLYFLYDVYNNINNINHDSCRHILRKDPANSHVNSIPLVYINNTTPKNKSQILIDFNLYIFCIYLIFYYSMLPKSRIKNLLFSLQEFSVLYLYHNKDLYLLYEYLQM